MEDYNIELPRAYKLGFHNNNCLQTGCVQGGIGYWQKMRDEFPDKFDAMAKMEQDLTYSKGEPVTMLKDQSAEAKTLVETTGLKWKQRIFLKPHKDYPELKDLSMMKGHPVESLIDCNGFCYQSKLEL